MSGLLGRLADLAGRTLASARATPPPDRAAEQAAADAAASASARATPPPDPAAEQAAADAPPDAAASPDAAIAPDATAPDIAALQPGGARDLGPAAGATRAAGPTPSGGPAPIPTPRPLAGHPPHPAATARTPGRREPDVPAAPPAPAPWPQERDADRPAGAAADAPASGARPGLLREIEIRVVAAGEAGAAPAARQAGDPRPELEERWRELGARLRAAHPPPGRSPGRVPAENGEQSMRPEAPPRPMAVASGEAQRPELVIRHLEIRIVAPAKEPAPVVASRPPDPKAGAWQAPARRYLRL